MKDEGEKQQEANEGKSGLAPVSLGFEFAAAVMGGCFVGVWIDRHFETAPWGTVGGASVGMIGGFYNFLRNSIKAFRATEQEILPGLRTESDLPADSGIQTNKESQP